MRGLRHTVLLGALVATVALCAGCAANDATAGPRAPAAPTLSGQVGWQWYLAGGAITPVPGVTLYDVDLFETTKAQVASIHRARALAICYFSAGTAEQWRPDISRYRAAVLGRADTGWQGERWVDIRARRVLEPILLARLALCKAKGFDGVEPDNIDSYQLGSDSGFALQAKDQLRFNEWIARSAHHLGLLVLQKNDGDQARQLEPFFDAVLSEDCITERSCSQFDPYRRANKAVLIAEYTDTGSTLANRCGRAGTNASIIIKHRMLDTWRLACPMTSTR